MACLRMFQRESERRHHHAGHSQQTPREGKEDKEGENVSSLEAGAESHSQSETTTTAAGATTILVSKDRSDTGTSGATHRSLFFIQLFVQSLSLSGNGAATLTTGSQLVAKASC